MPSTFVSGPKPGHNRQTAVGVPHAQWATWLCALGIGGYVATWGQLGRTS